MFVFVKSVESCILLRPSADLGTTSVKATFTDVAENPKILRCHRRTYLDYFYVDFVSAGVAFNRNWHAVSLSFLFLFSLQDT